MKKILLMALCFCLLTTTLTFAAERPNVVVLLADDLGWRDLSACGSTYYESPNIDRIAKEGMLFTQGYATCQVCSPSRSSLMTGKYTPLTGITDWIGAKTGPDWRKTGRGDSLLPPEYSHNLNHDGTTLAEAFRDAGYKTFFAGKWHLGGTGSLPTDHGFEINIGGNHTGGPRGGYFDPYQNPQLPNRKAGEPLPIRLASETASFIRKNKDKPFLAYLAFYSVHGPIQTSQKHWKKFREKAVKQGLPEKRFLWDRRLPVRQVQDCPIYAGMIAEMDNGVGLVLDTLKELGLEKNTIVVFTSDNGGVSSGDAYATSNLPLRGGKGRQWEGGIRVPYMVKAPGVTKPGSTCSVPVSGIDLYPTLAALADISLPKKQKVCGVSLVPLLEGKADKPLATRDLFWHYPHYGNQGGEPSSIIRNGNWKLIHYYEDGRDELYNLATDAVEQKDIAANNPEMAKAMRGRLDQWLKATSAKLPVKDTQYDAKKFAARMNNTRTKRMPGLEKQHASFVSENYQPKGNWWGSKD